MKTLLIALAALALSACSSTSPTFSKWEPCSVSTGPQPTKPGGGTLIPQRAPCGLLEVVLVDGTVLPDTISTAGGSSSAE